MAARVGEGEEVGMGDKEATKGRKSMEPRILKVGAVEKVREGEGEEAGVGRWLGGVIVGMGGLQGSH